MFSFSVWQKTDIGPGGYAQVGSVEQGVPVTRTADDSLDSAAVTVRSAQKDPYPAFTPCKIADDGLTACFLTAQDTAQTYCRLPGKHSWQHSLLLIKPTKYLEKIVLYNICLSNSADTLWQQLQKAVFNALPRVAAGADEVPDPIFSFTAAVQEKTQHVPGEDFSYDVITLRELLNNMLSVVNCRAVVHEITDFDDITIDILDLGQTLKGDLSSEEVPCIFDERSNSAEDLNGRMVARGFNSVSRIPVVQGPESFKTAEADLTSDNSTVQLMFGPESIEKFSVISRIPLRITYHAQASSDDYIFPAGSVFDLTSRVKDSEEAVAMSESQQASYLFYTRGDPTIDASRTYQYMFFTYSNIVSIVQSAIKERYPSWRDLPGNEESTWNGWDPSDLEPVSGGTLTTRNLLAEVSYLPVIDTVLDITKPGTYGAARLRPAVIDGQADNSIDISRHGENLLGKAARTGNDALILDQKLYDKGDLLPILYETTDGYVLCKQDISLYDEFYKVRNYFTRHFNSVSERISRRREKRLYPIPPAGVECPLVFKQFVVFSDYVISGTPSPARTSYLENSILGTLLGQASGRYIDRIVFSTKAAGGSEDLGCFELRTANYAAGNTLNFMARCLDNYSVGYSVGSQELGGARTVYNPYVDENGEFFELRVRAMCGRSSDSDEIYTALPATDLSFYSPQSNYMQNEAVWHYYFDRLQALTVVLNYELVPAEAAFGKIVLGKRFAEDNNLLSAAPARTLYLYEAEETYAKGERYFAKGTRIGPVDNYLSVIVTGLSSGRASPAAVKSWAIADEDGRLYLAVNKPLSTGVVIHMMVTETI